MKISSKVDNDMSDYCLLAKMYSMYKYPLYISTNPVFISINTVKIVI